MSEQRVRRCNHQGEDYGGGFEKEPDTFCCKECLKEGYLNGAKKIVDFKTKQEVTIANL